jgi:hypothetical protein
VAVLIPLAATSFPSPASAQWRYPPPPYPAYRYGSESHLRLNVKPKDASVYVDGYYAGQVSDFDGRFQRLHVLPGQHEITIYLEGYRSLKQRLYLSPDSTRTIDGELEKLGPGEPQEPQPEPAPDDTARVGPPERAYPMPPARGGPPRPGPTDRPPVERGPRTGPGQPSRFASLSIRVEPGGSTVLIDGERWDGPSDDERLIVQVSAGRHVIEVDREGYERVTTEVDVQAGETAPVNINLKRQ